MPNVGFDRYRGSWGFVISDDFDGDVFVGKSTNSHLERELQQGDYISFTMGMGSSGKPEARDVQLL